MTAFLAGAAAGVLSGMGVGGGTLLMIWMTVFAGLDQQRAGGINLLYFLPVSAAATACAGRAGLVDRRSFWRCAIPGVCAAIPAALIACAAAPGALRRVFGAVLIAAGLWQALGKKP